VTIIFITVKIILNRIKAIKIGNFDSIINEVFKFSIKEFTKKIIEASSNPIRIENNTMIKTYLSSLDFLKL